MSRGLVRILFFLTLLICCTPKANANHIVGGELKMRPNGNINTFEVTLIQFWDENNIVDATPTSSGNRDAFAVLFIYQKSDNRLIDSVRVNYINSETIAYQNKACAVVRSLNTTIGTYRGLITLNTNKFNAAAGYYMVWERCCRNSDINNIIDPGNSGMVFYIEFPPLQIRNSSPEFVPPNGQYICSNRPFSMNMSATDADGDELRYSLVTPLRGNTDAQRPTGNSASKRGYPTVNWESGVTLANVISGSDPLKISSSGILTVTADRLGLYVLTVQCEEMRNGKRIGLVRRDFQLLVIDCNDDQPEQPVIKLLSKPVTEVSFCPESPIQLETEISADWSYQWQLNGLNIPGETNPTITVKDSGQYSVVKSYTKKCSRDTSSQTVYAHYADPILALISADKDTLCRGESMKLLANDGSLKTGELIVWSKDNAVVGEKSAILSVSEPGSYVIEITNQTMGCAGKDTIIIGSEAFTLSLPDRKGVLEGSRTTLTPTINPPNLAYTYAWSPPHGIQSAITEKNAIVAPAQETVYTLTVTSSNGCVEEASTIVFVVDKMHIPNTFSPNGDGHNDTFQIYNAKDQIVEMRIFNRWGEVIFQSSGYNQPWDGTYKTTPVPAGSYPYVIKTAERDLNGTIQVLK
ncbi:gliding motility-associated C-terminal domain-containing protein [Dyadobacter arcticus]|uniref:Gliding motility-associated-like protein n=1 Tax=Dyadobacter arcticus TaxID=1078754 RepID=A0ABX0UMA1_9BACT|nr:gliding motility-associated C-terminal domain-containing protein [Dyadobacter arcticus]NIJ54137.1 gliding motility-associated-like protein [Dyadobacter arcticus]